MCLASFLLLFQFYVFSYYMKAHTSCMVPFQFYEQFDVDEIGALDNAELEGFIEPDSVRLDEVLKDYFKQKEKE